MRIYLIRHGRTPANEARLYCGASDVPLSPGGMRDLEEKRARGGYPDPEGLTVYTSGMRRTDETLALLFGKRPYTVSTGLRELDFGRFELRGYEELKDDPAYQAWISGDNEKNPCPGGESGLIFQWRVLETLESLLAAFGDKLVITHGGVIAVLMEALFPRESKSRYEWQPDFGSGYVLERDEQGDWRYTPLPEEKE